MITERAKEQLSRSPYPSVRRLRCIFDQGTIYLEGKLPTYYQKQLAQEAVSRLEGVRRVVNRAEVAD